MDSRRLLRFGARGAGAALRATRTVVDRAIAVTDQVSGPAEDVFVGASVAAPPAVITEPEPVDGEIVDAGHVSEAPELVDSDADPGAVDGAGAEIRVEEPWEGYAKLTAADIIDRLGHSSAAELAAVELYESAHRKRKTVLAAVAQEFKQPRT